MSARKRRVGEHASRRAATTRPVELPLEGVAGLRTWRTALLILCALLPIYIVNFRLTGAGDSLPTRVLPFSILREGNLNLDEFAWSPRSDGRLPYYVRRDGEHVYSVSTIGTALVVTPLYVLPAWWLAANGVGYDDVRARVVIVVMERIAAALLTALSASVLFVVLCRLTTHRWALALTLIYALGTSSWSISSQALWPHALSELCLVVLTAILLSPAPSRTGLIMAGLVVAAMVANRPQMAVFALPALLFLWQHRRRQMLWFVAIPLVAGVLLLAYNVAVFSNPIGGYGSLRHFDGSLSEGLFGLTVSPNRGLLIYTPIMLFALWGAVQVWRVSTAPPWLRWLTVGVVLHVLVHAKFDEWWAGYAYGPRYFTDVLPALTIFLVYGLVPFCRTAVMRAVVAVLALYGIGIQAIGVYAADDRWNRDPVPLEVRPDRVWDWGDLQIMRAVHNGWRAGELAPVMVDAFRDPVPARIIPLSEADLASDIGARGLPTQLPPGGTASGVVEVTNRSAVAWPAFNGDGVINSRNLMFLLVRWLANGRPLEGVGDVVPLPLNVSPGETVEVPVSVTAPSVPGDFELELRVSQAVDRRRGRTGQDALRLVVRVRRDQ
jgi:hypothetical protein